MSLLKKLFSADPVELEKKADRLFDEASFGPAKLAYEKALAALPTGAQASLAEKVRRCTDAIARERIEEAKVYLLRGSLELAEQELEGAIEVAHEQGLVAQAQALLDSLHAKDAQARAETHEQTDEERIALLMGQWDEAQADEYERYGDRLIEALLAMQQEHYQDARAQLESVLAEAPEPRYLWLEIGRARLLDEDPPGARRALQAFVDALQDDEGGEARLAANLTLARLADDSGEFEEAMRYFEDAVRAGSEDYRPYLAMGAFLRAKGHGAEAMEVLTTSLELSSKAGTDWRLLEELGLAAELVGKTDDARSFLEQVLEFFTSRQVTDFPPLAATTLAKLYESEGRLERAAGVYRALSQGSDREHHALYHFETGRLLDAIGLSEEARRMLTRAKALASEADGPLKARIAALLEPQSPVRGDSTR